jgi:hypothetical protein
VSSERTNIVDTQVGPVAATTSVGDVDGAEYIDGRPPERRCQRDGAGDLGASIINGKKHQRRAPWEVLPEIRERQPSMLKNIDGGPPGRQCGKFGSTYYQRKKTSTAGPQAPIGGPSHVRDPLGVL